MTYSLSDSVIQYRIKQVTCTNSQWSAKLLPVSIMRPGASILLPGDCMSRGGEVHLNLVVERKILSGGSFAPKPRAGNWALSRWSTQTNTA